MVRRAVLGSPENSIPTAHLLFSSLQRSAASGGQKDGAGNMAVNQSAKSSPEHSAHARARVRDIAQKSIARSEGSAVATFHRWQISEVVMPKGVGRPSGRASAATAPSWHAHPLRRCFAPACAGRNHTDGSAPDCSLMRNASGFARSRATALSGSSMSPNVITWVGQASTQAGCRP